jgi:hypothetical protein
MRFERIGRGMVQLISALMFCGLFATAPAIAQECGRSGQACCSTGVSCQGELGCSGGTCREIDQDMVAYANYCKRALGFTNPSAPLPYLSCNDSATVSNPTVRVETGRQAQIQLTLGSRTHFLRDNGPALEDGRDLWDLIQGNATRARGCDNPNYLQAECDDYYRLNVWKPDPANNQIVAVMHCRSATRAKPEPANAIQARKRLEAFLAASETAPLTERTRLFDQWNSSTEIVLILSNLSNGKTCFFHAASPYYGSRIPAPDDETDLSAPGVADRVWRELPVKPPYGPLERRDEWLRNGRNAWQRPDFMTCTGCHDNGPFINNPFISSMDEGGIPFLPHDKRWRPYLPLGFQKRTSESHYFIRTDPVRARGGGTEPQKCTACHSIGNGSGTSTWFDRAAGWAMPQTASEAAFSHERLRRYMPPTVEPDARGFYRQNGAHIDAIRCCAENPDWLGCYRVNRASPMSPGVQGTGPKSCTASSCGGWNQECCADEQSQPCNHGALACDPGARVCKFREELGLIERF